MTLSGDIRRLDPAASANFHDVIPSEQANELSVVGALNEILRQRLLIAACGIATFLLVVLVVFIIPRKFSASSSFIPQSRRAASSLAGIAAQFGVPMAGADPGQSPAFYADLIKTREILGPVVDARYWAPVLNARDSVTLVQVLGKGANGPVLQREAAIRKIREDVAADVALKTGTVILVVNAGDPDLAVQVNRKILDRVNAFNLEKRQTQAATERRFVERRLDEVRQELRAAEDRLQAFMQGNRDYRNSPSLSFEHDRIERDVSMRQQLYTSLGQSYEQAKIDEIRDSPLITIIEEPVRPVFPNPRGLIGKALMALAAGLLLGLCIAFARYAVHQGRAGSSEELSQLRRLMSETVDGVLRPWRKRRHVD